MIDEDERARDTRRYLMGFALAVGLTVLSFLAVLVPGLGRGTVYAALGLLALAQIVVHLRCFLHIDLSRQKREDLQLILFTVLIISILTIGTVWILGDLMQRMM